MNTTLKTMLSAALLAAFASGQDPAGALQRAQVLEQQEGDLKAAEQAYRALVDGITPAAAPDVQQQAALRLGTLLWRLDQKDEGKRYLQMARLGGGALAEAAQAVLDGKTEAGQQEQERAARAQALVDKLSDQLDTEYSTTSSGDAATRPWQATKKDLLWLGETAAGQLASKLRQHRKRTDWAQTPIADRIDRTLAQILWQIGTPQAQKFFAEVATDSDRQWRTLMAAPCNNAATDMPPSAMAFLRVPDPEGDVHKAVTELAGKLPLEQLKSMLSDALPAMRGAGLAGISSHWPRLTPEVREALLRDLAEPLRTALHGVDPGPARLAWQLLSQLAITGPRSARRLFLTELAQWPAEIADPTRQIGMGDFRLDDGELDLLLAAARTIRAQRPAAELDGDRAWEAVTRLFAMHQPEWTAASVDKVLQLIELGGANYRVSATPSWCPRVLALATQEQLLRLLRDFPRLVEVRSTLEQLNQIDLPAGSFTALRDTVEQCLASPPQYWKVLERSNGRRGAPNSLLVPGTELTMLLDLIGRTGDADAAPWLMTLVDRIPGAADAVAFQLVNLSIADVGEPARAAMRRLLVWEGTPEYELRSRSLLFAELARLGDVASIPLFPRAYAAGPGFYQGYTHPLKAGTSGRTSPRRGGPTATNTNMQWNPMGIGWLGLRPTGNGQTAVPWYGYSDDQLITAWRTLLDSDQRDAVLAEISSNMRDLVPLPVLPLLASCVPDLQARATDNQGQSALQSVLGQFSRVTTDLVDAGSPMREAIATLLQASKPGLYTCAFLPPKVLKAMEPEVRARLAVSDEIAPYMDELQHAGIEPSTEDWLRALQTNNSYYRRDLLARLPAKPAPAILRAVEARLQDESSETRAAACSALARFLDPDSVAPLLLALRDGDAKVRAAAADALERLRFYQEQQAHWAQVQSGIEVSKDNALAKLLAQAKPDQPRDQRLLAIRSLAVLDQPEALPYLIDWTKDQDAGIAEAARAAVAQIHQAAAAGTKK